MKAYIFGSLLVALALCNMAVAQAGSLKCRDVKVTYESYRPLHSQFGVERISLSPMPNVGEVKKTPQQTRWLVQSQPDFRKQGPWTTTIMIGDKRGASLKLTFPNHGNQGITSEWLNEKLLFMRLWLGRIVSVDMIFDVEKATLTYSEAANYGQLIQPCE